VTIGAEEAYRQRVVGFVDLHAVCGELGVRMEQVDSYSLRSAASRDTALRTETKLLLLAGWGRIVPDWWLEMLGLGAFSVHTAGMPLPFGRGRSPINWSIALGMKTLFCQLFQLESRPDRGRIVDVFPFEVSNLDDCLTVHLKNTVARLKLYERHLPAMLAGTVRLSPQVGCWDSWFDKRTESDNTIDWCAPVEQVHDLVRAVTRPFSGARTRLDDNGVLRDLTVWRAMPFGSGFTWAGSRPGEILQVFETGQFLVRAGDTSLLVEEYEGHPIGWRDLGKRFHTVATT
jgi:methionyl-tRNA formyltransferase